MDRFVDCVPVPSKNIRSLPVNQPTDEQLIAAYRTGETGALRTLIERYHVNLMRFLTRLVGDKHGAEDVFQETFLQIHVSAHTFDTTRRFKPWLFTIAANKGRDYLRKKARRQALDLSAPVAGSSGWGGSSDAPSYVDLMEVDVPQPDQALKGQETQQQVQHAINSLPLPLREILLLAYFQRLSYNQIAEELGIPLGTVKSRLHAAVAAFARSWKQMQEGSDSR